MRLIVGIVVVSLVLPGAAFAGGGDEVVRPGAITRAANREAARLAQTGLNPNGGNPYVTPAALMIAAGAAVAILGASMPQFRTQNDDYDLCAAANGGPTGPSTRNPACDDLRDANRGFVWVGGAAIAAGAALLSVGAFKNVTVRVAPGRAVVAKTTRF
jgi:hypothetical protein